MSLNHHFIGVPREYTEKLARLQQVYMSDGVLIRYHKFSDVPKPIDPHADGFAGKYLMDYYLANKRNAVHIHDRIILKQLEDFSSIKTFFIGFIPCVGLNYYGMTLIPWDSIPDFADSVSKLPKIAEVNKLRSLYEEAYTNHKDILHCGI